MQLAIDVEVNVITMLNAFFITHSSANQRLLRNTTLITEAKRIGVSTLAPADRQKNYIKYQIEVIFEPSWDSQLD